MSTPDVESLINVTVPEVEPPRSYLKLVLIVAGCATVTLLAAVAGLVFALVASTGREDDLGTQLKCLRQSTLIYDDAIANGLKLSVALKVGETRALAAVASGDDEALRHAVAETTLRINGDGTEENPGSDKVLQEITDAVTARRAAVGDTTTGQKGRCS